MRSFFHHRNRKGDEAGVLTAFVAVLAVALLAIVGLAVDCGRAIAAQGLAADEAGQAARVGAAQLSLNALRAGRLVINESHAVRMAEQYMVLAGHPGTASVQGGTVTVSVKEAMPTTILGIVGIRSIVVSATSSATDVSGVTGQG